jgi:phosphatidylglycerophosphatase GEP4
MLQDATSVNVLLHSTKKPGCGAEIMEYFRTAADSNVTKPSQIAIVGDRLFTDVLMANMMGSWSVWIKDGVVQEKNLVSILHNTVHAAYAKGNPVLGLGETFAKVLVPIQP